MCGGRWPGEWGLGAEAGRGSVHELELQADTSQPPAWELEMPATLDARGRSLPSCAPRDTQLPGAAERTRASRSHVRVGHAGEAIYGGWRVLIAFGARCPKVSEMEIRLRWAAGPAWRDSFLAATQEVAPLFGPVEMLMLLWGFGSWGLTPPRGWTECIMLNAMAQLPRHTPHTLSSLCMSLAKIDCIPHPQQIEAILSHSLSLMPKSNPQSLANLLWAVAHKDWLHSAHLPLPRAARPHISLEGRSDPRTRTTRGESGLRSSSSSSRHAFVGGMPNADTDGDQSKERVYAREIVHVYQGSAFHGGNPAIVSERLDPHDGRLRTAWLLSFLDSSRPRLPDFSPMELSSVLFCLSKMRLRPGKNCFWNLLPAFTRTTSARG
ncbi:MAG: hypothetical protein WDW38_005519 [Sanguina aurantia]